jgi:CheY-like chemotaxis protein
MISVLIVDDNKVKALRISDAINNTLLDDAVSIQTSAHAHAASQMLRAQQFDLMVLDLSIPLRDDEEPRADGGLRLLHSIKQSRACHIPTHIIGLTAFDELQKIHRNPFEEEGWILLLYQENSNAWEVSLKQKVAHIVGTKQSLQAPEKTKASPWIAGSFYLFTTLVLIAAFGVIARYVPWYGLPLVILAVLLTVPGIGFLQLKHDGALHERSIVHLYKA